MPSGIREDYSICPECSVAVFDWEEQPHVCDETHWRAHQLTQEMLQPSFEEQFAAYYQERECGLELYFACWQRLATPKILL